MCINCASHLQDLRVELGTARFHSTCKICNTDLAPTLDVPCAEDRCILYDLPVLELKLALQEVMPGRWIEGVKKNE